MDEVNKLFALWFVVLVLFVYLAYQGWQTLVKPLWLRWQTAQFRRWTMESQIDFVAPVRPLRLG